jgi:transcriptional regulator with XRE-family HTH domain
MHITARMENIRDIRRALGLSQAEMADRLGLHQSAISRLERGRRELDKRTILAAQALLFAAQRDAAA